VFVLRIGRSCGSCKDSGGTPESGKKQKDAPKGMPGVQAQYSTFGASFASCYKLFDNRDGFLMVWEILKN
jgi:hypothetical protein